MPISQAGALNTTALVVPDLYVQIVPPQQLNLNGQPTNVVGVVGSATWGPVNQPVIIGDMGGYAASFGAIQPSLYDMGTQVATAVQQGANNFRCLRVSDGTDTKATVQLLAANNAYPMALTALYTGTLGNQLALSLFQRPDAGWRLVIGLPGLQPEYYDAPPGTAASVWTALVGAISTGGANGHPSRLVTGALGTATGTAPAAVSGVTLAGGTDGVSGVTAATLVGIDAAPRTGMYALRGQGCSIGVLADTFDATTWTTQAEFGESEGVYMILTGTPGETITGAATNKQTAGLVSYAAKLMLGDWIYWTDPTTGTIRLVSPQGFVAGRLANLSPEQSSLNKQLYSIAGSQKSGGALGTATYADADLQSLGLVGIDVIANPQPGGAYWGVRFGHNSSASLGAATNGDNYTRLTNYIAATLAAGMGQYVGQVINATLFQNITATQLAFLQNLLGQGILGSTDGSLPFSVVCNTSNNPLSRTSLGYVQSDAQIQYQAINEKFVVNIQGGTGVVVSRATTPNGQIGA